MLPGHLAIKKSPGWGSEASKRGGSPQCPAVKPEHEFLLVVLGLLLGLFLFPLLAAGFPRLVRLHGRHDVADPSLDVLQGLVPSAAEIWNHHFPEIIHV